MNYQKIYDDVCKRGQIRILEKDVYTEKHHIIPRCMGGTNDKCNISVLTAREHYLVHKLLTLIYPENKKIKAAFFFMCQSSKKNLNRYTPTSRVFEYLKILNSDIHKNKIISQEMRSKLRKHNLGKKHTEASKKKMSEAHMGFKHTEEALLKMKKPQSKIHSDKISKSLKGKTKSDIHRKNISNSVKQLYTDGYINPMKNKKHTKESIEKRLLSTAGFKHSAESRQKMKDNHPSKKENWINPRIYESMSDISKNKQKNTWNTKKETGWVSPLKNKIKTKPIQLYDTINNVEYESMSDAKKKLNLLSINKVKNLIKRGILCRKEN